MAESIRNSVSKVLSQTIPNENIARQKMTGLVDVLKNTVNNIGNNWTSKDREDYIFNQVISLDFINDGQFILNNKACVAKMKSVYNSSDPGGCIGTY